MGRPSLAIPDLFGSNVPGTRSVFGKWKSDPALFILVDVGFPVSLIVHTWAFIVSLMVILGI